MKGKGLNAESITQISSAIAKHNLDRGGKEIEIPTAEIHKILKPAEKKEPEIAGISEDIEEGFKKGGTILAAELTTLVHDIKSLSPTEQAEGNALLGVHDNILNLQKQSFESKASANLNKRMGNAVGAARSTTQFLEAQLKLNEQLGKSTQFADRFRVSLARIEERMANFKGDLGEATVQGMNAGFLDAVKGITDLDRLRQDKKDGIHPVEGFALSNWRHFKCRIRKTTATPCG